MSYSLRQEYWSRLPCCPPWNLPDLGIKHMSLRPPVIAGGFSTASTTWEAPSNEYGDSISNQQPPQKESPGPPWFYW